MFCTAKGNERGNEVWEVKIPSCCGTDGTGQAWLREIYTVWMKIMDKVCRVWVYVHAQDHDVWNIYKGRTLKYFTWKQWLFIIFRPYFGHRVALTCFYNVRKEEVGSTKCSWETVWLWNLPEGSRNEPRPPPYPPPGRRHRLNDEGTQSSVQTNEGHLFAEKHDFCGFVIKLVRIKKSLMMKVSKHYTGTALHAR